MSLLANIEVFYSIKNAVIIYFLIFSNDMDHLFNFIKQADIK